MKIQIVQTPDGWAVFERQADDSPVISHEPRVTTAALTLLKQIMRGAGKEA